MQMIYQCIKNGLYIHLLTALLYYTTNNAYIAWNVSIKLYSLNYFYWFGHLYSYLPNPKYNWIKQFIRFTDTGHMASLLPFFWKNAIPVCHNVHFLIMGGYWIGKVAFGLKDSDRLDSTISKSILEWNIDLCTYIHHSIPYILILILCREQMSDKKRICSYEYQESTLFYSYLWLYCWFFFIYLPWRLYTKDYVYSILDCKQTPLHITLGFVCIVHFILYLANQILFIDCFFYNIDPQWLMNEF